MSQWLYISGGEQSGPVDIAILRQMADDGQLQPSDLIWREGLPEWVAASTEEQVFPAKARTQWFYMSEGQQIGPVGTTELKQLAQNGQLQPLDLIWRDGLRDWVRASTAKGLFSAGTQPDSKSPQSQTGGSKSTADANESPISRVERVVKANSGNAYANSPVMAAIKKGTAKAGFNSASKTQAHLIAIIKWAVMGLVVLTSYMVFLAGTRLFPSLGQDASGAALPLMLVALIAVVGFIPLSLALIVRLALLAYLSKDSVLKVTSVVGITVLVIGLFCGWPCVSELWDMSSAKRVTSSGGREQTLSYADLDSKFGFGTLEHPQQLAKTDSQLQRESVALLNSSIAWKGVVIDVRGGQVLIAMRQTSMRNEVALIPGWWDAWKLDGINRGDLISFTGVLAGFGDPYPYAVAHGTITSTHAASDEEAKASLPQ